MEYTQLTLNDWMEIKQKIRLELQGIKHSFVRIGYHLRQIEDQKLYERDGYSTITEFAEKEYGLQASTTSRFMAINREYSIDGYSEVLRPEYEALGRSQLEEMLHLPEEDRALITKDTPREDIRELKRFNKTEPIEPESPWVKDFWEANTDLYQEILAAEGIEEKKDLVNPAGSRTFRKGYYFVSFQETGIKIKKFGGSVEDMEWDDFFEITGRLSIEIAEKPEEPFAPAQLANASTEGESKEEEKSEEKQEEKPVNNPSKLKKTLLKSEKPEQTEPKAEQIEKKPEPIPERIAPEEAEEIPPATVNTSTEADFEKPKKERVEKLEIIAEIHNGERYYSIRYRYVEEEEEHIGYSSYDFGQVLEFIKEYFELFQVARKGMRND